MYNDGSLEQDIAMRQISVKDPDIRIDYQLYTVKTEFESESQFKQQLSQSQNRKIYQRFLAVLI